MKPNRLIKAEPTIDGAGVKINRIAGQGLHKLLDPYLLVDEIKSDEGQDYMAGFPAHPHRGFETIIYLIRGRMRHEDHLGHQKVMSDGGVQWMTTGRGIVHSEMPEPSTGRFHGFQIWLNLPSAEKMIEPAYHDLSSDVLNVVEFAEGTVKMMAGTMAVNGESYSAEFQSEIRTQPSIADLHANRLSELELGAQPNSKLLVYVYEGHANEIPAGSIGVYDTGFARLSTTEGGFNALVLSGQPLKEPVVQHGPFVMNTADEIKVAIQDFSTGQFV